MRHNPRAPTNMYSQIGLGRRAQIRPAQRSQAHALQSAQTGRENQRTQGGPATDMATDYDAPRKSEDDVNEDSLEELKARRANKSASSVDVDETEQAEGFELPGADLSGEELSVRVLPRQNDEFTCSKCFLVHHRSQLASESKGFLVCSECAA